MLNSIAGAVGVDDEHAHFSSTPMIDTHTRLNSTVRNRLVKESQNNAALILRSNPNTCLTSSLISFAVRAEKKKDARVNASLSPSSLYTCSCSFLHASVGSPARLPTYLASANPRKKSPILVSSSRPTILETSIVGETHPQVSHLMRVGTRENDGEGGGGTYIDRAGR